MSKSANEVYQLLEDMALNNCQWPNERASPKKPNRVHELDVFNNITVQVSFLSCYFCNGPHLTTECQKGNPCGQISVEQAQYLSKFPQPQFNPYSNSFNSRWRNHLNLSLRNNPNVMHPMKQVKPSPSKKKKASSEDTMSELAEYQLESRKSQA